MAPPLSGVEDLRAEVPVGQQRRAAPRSRIGKASSTSRLVTRMFQVKIGIRNIVMPGARSVITVVIMLTRAEDRAQTRDSARPMIHRSAPTPGELIASLSGE